MTAFTDSVGRNPRGVLRLSMPMDFCQYLLSDALAAFLDAHSGVSLDLDFTPRRVDLVGERFDAAIRIGALADSSLISCHLVTMTRGLYASPNYLARSARPREPRDLSEHRILQAGQQYSAINSLKFTRGGETEAPDVPSRVRSGAVGVLRTLAIAGAGIAAIPNAFCTEEIAAGRLVRLLSDWELESGGSPLPHPSGEAPAEQDTALHRSYQGALLRTAGRGLRRQKYRSARFLRTDHAWRGIVSPDSPYAALFGLERRDAIVEGRRAEPGADRLAAAKRHDERRRRLSDDQRGKVSPAAFADRRRRNDAVVPVGKMGANARSTSVFGALHELCSNWIERDRTRRRHQMRLGPGKEFVDLTRVGSAFLQWRQELGGERH